MEVKSRSLRSRRRPPSRWVLLLLMAIIAVVGMQNVLWLAVPMNVNWHMIATTKSEGTAGKKKRFAYAFYATTSAYACGAFVQVAQLRDLGTPSGIDFVILVYGEASTNPGVAEQASRMNIILKHVEHLHILGANVDKGRRHNGVKHNSYYTNVMVKLRVFELYEYDRIVYMDTDMMVRQNLDHLFQDNGDRLPSSMTLAAAKVTNRKNTDPLRFCSCFMVIQPSRQLSNRILKYYGTNSSSILNHHGPMYDMDLLNHEFRSEVTLLPGSYGLLMAIWDNHNVTDVGENYDEEEWYQQILQGPPNWVPPPSSFHPSRVKSRHDLFQESLVLHFTPNKPMVERTLASIKRSQPNADPQYYATFEKWYSLASYVCSSLDMSHKIHKYDQHRTSKFERTNQYSDYFN